jgi:hypothetical protein
LAIEIAMGAKETEAIPAIRSFPHFDCVDRHGRSSFVGWDPVTHHGSITVSVESRDTWDMQKVPTKNRPRKNGDSYLENDL